MVMSWTAENDRLLFVTLIKTHGVSVNAQLIKEGWPSDAGEKPTARAIQERFAKLRKQCGLQVSLQKPGGSGKGTPRSSKFTTPTTTPRKRPNKSEDTESDAEDHCTEEESPTKKPKSTQRGVGAGAGACRGRGRGRMLGGGNRENAGSPMGVRVKSEVLESPIGSPAFNQLSARASQIKADYNDPFESSFGMPTQDLGLSNSFQNATGALNGLPQDGFFGFNGTSHDMGGFGMDFNADAYSGDPGLSVQNPLANSAPRFQSSTGHQGMKATPRAVPKPASARARRPSAAPSEDSVDQELRARSARRASRQASSGMAAYIRAEKEEDLANGEKTSEEDSQASEFRESDGDYV